MQEQIFLNVFENNVQSIVYILRNNCLKIDKNEFEQFSQDSNNVFFFLCEVSMTGEVILHHKYRVIFRSFD